MSGKVKLNKIIDSSQTTEINFDPDSSPETWEHFKRIYFSDKKIQFNKIKKYFDINEDRYGGEECLRIYKQKKDDVFLEYPELKIGGDTDWNFNDNKENDYKYSKYKIFVDKIIYDKKISKTRTFELIKKLNFCNSMHHTLLNFSPMLVSGYLQNIKGGGCYGLDRLDSFITMIDNYYKETIRKEITNNYSSTSDSKKIIDNETIEKFQIIELTKVSKFIRYTKIFESDINPIFTNRQSNFEARIDYMDLFSDVYDYVVQHYLITDVDFINDLIENGKKEIITPDDVENYMNLAIRYWKYREDFITEHFENCYKKYPLLSEYYSRLPNS
ncbi:MAG: hypothetical protein Q4A90_07490 [Streptococcus sp.]|nr:hypothetical protein [Streptococcus sp.]